MTLSAGTKLGLFEILSLLGAGGNIHPSQKQTTVNK